MMALLIKGKNRLLADLFIGFVSLIVLSGCSSIRPNQTHYYTLEPQAIPAPMHSLVQGKVIGVAKLNMSKCTRNPSILIKISPEEVCYASGHEWVEPVEDLLQGTLSAHLRQLAPQAWVVDTPWPAAHKPDYILYAAVDELWVDCYRHCISLKARFSWFKGDQYLTTGTQSLQRELSRMEYRLIVHQINLLWSEFAQLAYQALDKNLQPPAPPVDVSLQGRFLSSDHLDCSSNIDEALCALDCLQKIQN